MSNLHVIWFTCIWFISHGGYSVESKKDLRLIVDFVKHINRPIVVNAKVDWDQSKKAELIILLSSLPVKSTFIKYVKNIVEKPSSPVFKEAEKNDHLILADLRCNDVAEFVEEANITEKFMLPYKWLFLDGISNTEIVPRELYEMNILFNSEVTVAKYDGNESYYLYLIYKKTALGRWHSEFYGKWSESEGLQISRAMDVTTFMRRKDFEKIPIVTSYIINHESTKQDLSNLRNNPGDAATIAGYRHNIHLFDFMNATRVIIFTDTWGYFINGSWNGMAGNLFKGEAELGGTVIFINKQRLGILEYLSHPIKTSVKFVFRRPPLSYQHNLLLLPFHTTVWICVCGFAALYIVLVYINSKWDVWKKETPHEETSDVTMLRPDLGEITLFVISAMAQQGSHFELKGSLGRVVMMILFMAFLFIYTSYSACIVALLQSSSNNIRTLSDLLNSRLELGVEETPYNRYYFSTATEPTRKAIYETKVAPKGSKPNFLSLEEGVRKIRKEPFAFHMNCASGYKLMNEFYYEHEKCGLQEISFVMDDKPWIACRKTSPYKEIFKIGIRRLHENGVIERENALVFGKKPDCYSQGSFASVSIRDCYMAFLVLLYGAVLSVVIVLIEILLNRRR